MEPGAAATTGTVTWTDPDWRDAALAWAEEHLAEHGRRRVAAPEQVHVRPWSTAIRIPTDGGPVWLKSVGSGSAQEPVLAEALGRWVPDRVLVPLAVHPHRRLLLLPDGGPTLRELGGSRHVEAWEALLTSYARLQVALVGHADAMVGLGVPDARPEQLPALASTLLADDDALLVGRPEGLDPVVRQRLVDRSADHADLCRVLGAGPVPPSLEHDDLHDADVFVVGNGHRFFDWGDACVSHPFLGLLVPLRMASSALDLAPGHPVLGRLRDAYLQPWRPFAAAPVLRELCDVALRVAPLLRAHTWQRILVGLLPAERAEWQPHVARWAAESLEPGPLASVPGG